MPIVQAVPDDVGFDIRHRHPLSNNMPIQPCAGDIAHEQGSDQPVDLG